jgi:hypothetical protein
VVYFWTQYLGDSGKCVNPNVIADSTYAHSAVSAAADCKCDLLGAKLLLVAIIWEPRHMSAPETFPTIYSQFYS